MNKIENRIVPVSIEEELKKSYLDYAMSVIIGRALPEARDGLKPVHRRILYAMNILGNDWNKIYKKSARVVGDVIGKYHPHGDTAVYDTIVRMAQPFSLRYMLIDGQGNFGSVDGDSAAAMRYTEVRLSKIAHELMNDIEKETVDFVDNYDGTEKIPEIMPTKIPNLLINGSSGIAVGMASNIPPHNISEVINGCLAYIDNEHISLESLMKYIKGPDFPTAGIINGREGIEQAYRTGRGKIYIRAYAEVKTDTKTGRETIIVHEIPYQVNKARLIEKIAELVKEKRINGISGLRDESDKDGMRIIIEVKKDAIANIVLNNLYSQTPLQVSYGINMVALNQGKPQVMNLKEILKAFIYHRRQIITRRTNFELRKARDRIHILEALAIALDNIDQIIKPIRNSTTPEEAKIKLISHAWEIGKITTTLEHIPNPIFHPEWMISSECGVQNNQYYLTEKQAQAILDLKLQKLTNLEHKKILNECKDLQNTILYLINIISNTQTLTEVIKQELKLIDKEYGDPRRTNIINNKVEIKIEDLINQETVIVTISHYGYVKYQPLTDYETQKRGGKGKSAASIKEKDFIEHLLVANTHDTILCFSSFGRLYWIKIYQLPEASRIARGRPINNLIPLQQNERITTILPVCKYTEGVNVLMATASGIVKKTSLIELNRPRSSGIIALHLTEGDELIGADLTSGSDEIMLFSAAGKVVRFQEHTVRTMGRNATGVCGIKLTKSDKVVSLIVPRNKGSILTVTQNGYGKRTLVDEYPIKSRGTHGVISMKVTKRNGFIVGAVQVNNSDQIMMITNTGDLVRTRVSEINIVGRNTHGVTLIRTATNESVVGLQRIVEPVFDIYSTNNIDLSKDIFDYK